MKGIVVEINEKDAVILSDEGLFTKVKNRNYQIGQSIRTDENKKFASKWIVGAASMAAALALCTTGAFAYYTPTDYVSLDVNPSVEYSVNRFDRILDVKAVDDDGKAILLELDLKNKKIQNGLRETLGQLIADGYLTDDPDSGVVITASNDDMEEAEQLAAELEREVKTYLDTKADIAAEVDAEAVGLDRVEEARDLGVTPGKLSLVEKLQESTSGAISKEEWLAMPVKEINKAIKENHRLEKEKNKGREEIESEDGIKGQKGDAPKPEKAQSKPEKVRPNDQNTNQNSKQETERVINDNFNSNSNSKGRGNSNSNSNGSGGSDDGNGNNSDGGNSDGSDGGNSNNSGGQHDDKSKPDNGKSSKGDDN